MSRPEEEIDRFFSLVEYGVEWGGSKCLLWNGNKGGGQRGPSFVLDTPHGYRVNPIKYAYALEHGEIFLKENVLVTHRCKDPLCVNFLHILCANIDQVSGGNASLRKSDWCRNGEHLRSDFEKKDTYGRAFCGGCAEAADRRRRHREREERIYRRTGN